MTLFATYLNSPLIFDDFRHVFTYQFMWCNLSLNTNTTDRGRANVVHSYFLYGFVLPSIFSFSSFPGRDNRSIRRATHKGNVIFNFNDITQPIICIDFAKGEKKKILRVTKHRMVHWTVPFSECSQSDLASRRTRIIDYTLLRRSTLWCRSQAIEVALALLRARVLYLVPSPATLKLSATFGKQTIRRWVAINCNNQPSLRYLFRPFQHLLHPVAHILLRQGWRLIGTSYRWHMPVNRLTLQDIALHKREIVSREYISTLNY